MDSFVSRSVRKNPGTTIVVWMPNGSTSNRNDSIHPSRPNFEAAYAEQNSCPTIPAVEDIVTYSEVTLTIPLYRAEEDDAAAAAPPAGLDTRPRVFASFAPEEAARVYGTPHDAPDGRPPSEPPPSRAHRRGERLR